MDPTLDNRMILGGIGNLRLAPHVREGRPTTSVSHVARPAPAAAPPEGSAPSRARGFVAQEKVTISAAAQSALAGEASAPASAPESAPAPVDVAATPAGASDVVPASVASAYAAASQTTAPAGSPGPAPTANALFA